MQLGRAARDVDGMRAAAPDGGDHLVDDGVRHHRVGPVRTRVHVAVAARHVAQLAEIHLEDLQARRPQPRPGVAVELDAPAVARERHRGQHLELARRRGERRLAPGEAQRGARRRLVVLQVGGDFLEKYGDARVHYMPSFFAPSRICMPCTSDAPPRIATATCSASVICSKSAPFCWQSWV